MLTSAPLAATTATLTRPARTQLGRTLVRATLATRAMVWHAWMTTSALWGHTTVTLMAHVPTILARSPAVATPAIRVTV